MRRHIGEQGVRLVRTSFAFAAAVQQRNLPRALDIEAQERGFLNWAQYAREWPKMSAKVRVSVEQQIIGK